MIKQHAQRKLVLFSFLQDNRISSRCFDAISSLETESQEKEATIVAVNTLCSINKCNVIKTFIKHCKNFKTDDEVDYCPDAKNAYGALQNKN